MHDDLIERRLRAVLRDEADSLPFTITAAELQRRAGLRGRGPGNRRLTLLLAAAVAIGALGATALLGALSNRPLPSLVTQSTQPPGETPPASAGLPRILPALDELISPSRAPVLVAQASGPADVPRDPLSDAIGQLVPIVALGDLQAGGEYQISVACLGRIPLEVALKPVGLSGSTEGPRFTCDGIVREETVSIDGAASAYLQYRTATSWRVVIRGDGQQLPLPTTNPVLPPMFEGVDELVRLDDAVVEAGSEAWGSSGLLLRHIGAVPARVIYAAQVWCEPGATVRLLFADRIDGVLTPSVETALACDGLVHDLGFPLPLPNGSPVFVAAAPETRWSVLISSATPPVSLADDVRDWQLAGGIGPSLHFADSEMSFSDMAGERGGPLMVVLECLGPEQDIAVHVDLEGILGDAFQAHTANCGPDGERTGFTFDTGANGYIVRHAAPMGTWTAMSLLIPAASAGP